MDWGVGLKVSHLSPANAAGEDNNISVLWECQDANPGPRSPKQARTLSIERRQLPGSGYSVFMENPTEGPRPGVRCRSASYLAGKCPTMTTRCSGPSEPQPSSALRPWKQAAAGGPRGHAPARRADRSRGIVGGGALLPPGSGSCPWSLDLGILGHWKAVRAIDPSVAQASSLHRRSIGGCRLARSGGHDLPSRSISAGWRWRRCAAARHQFNQVDRGLH